MPAAAAPPVPAKADDRSPLPDGVERWTLRELAIAEARPLAERGAVFRTAWLDQYFRGQPWYRPTGFDWRRLPSDEKARAGALARCRAGLSTAALAKKQDEFWQRKRQARAKCPLAVSAGGKRAANSVAVQEHGGLRLWDLATATSRSVPSNAGSAPMWPANLAFSRDGSRLLSVETLNHAAQVSIWDSASLTPLPPFQWVDTSALYYVPNEYYVLASDGQSVLVPDVRHEMWRVVSLADAKRQLVLPAKAILSPASRVECTADRSGVLAVAAGRAWFWRAKGAARMGVVDMLDPVALSGAEDADLSPHGRSIAVADDLGPVCVLDVNAPARKRCLASSRLGSFEFVDFSPKGDKLLATTESLGLAVWQVPSGSLLYERPARAASLGCAKRPAAFLPDGEHVVLAGETGGLEIIALGTGVAKIIAREGPVPPLDDERIEEALLAQATGATMSSGHLRQLSYEEQPLLFEQPLTKAELLRTARFGVDLRSLETLIQARRGRSFRSPRWQAHARAQSWYRPDASYTSDRLTPLDRENLTLIERVRRELDPRPLPPAPDIVASAPVTAFPACPSGSTRVDRSEHGRVTAKCVAKRTGREVLEGPEWIWFPTGRLSEAHAWLDGERHGSALAWYFTGARRVAGAYARGSRDGEWSTYHRNGLVALRGHYQQGVPNGPWTSFYDNGRRAIALTYRAGSPDPSVPIEFFAPDGRRWPEGTKLRCADAVCATPIAQLDFDSLPPLLVGSCGHGVSNFDRPLPRASWAAVLAAAKHAWPPDAGDRRNREPRLRRVERRRLQRERTRRDPHAPERRVARGRSTHDRGVQRNARA